MYTTTCFCVCYTTYSVSTRFNFLKKQRSIQSFLSFTTKTSIQILIMLYCNTLKLSLRRSCTRSGYCRNRQSSRSNHLSQILGIKSRPRAHLLHHPLRSPLGRSLRSLWLRDGAISTDAVRISLVPSCFRTPSFRQTRFRWFILQSKISLGFSEFPFTDCAR